ncbi:MAG: sialate O-acetylesterase [Armatimonadota bacterium]|nr:sialate O-acetylesterase [bacterium]
MLQWGVTITDGPSDWQVIQRDDKDVASITIRGKWRASEAVFSVQARVVSEATGAPVTRHLDWQDARIDIDSSEFEITLAGIPCGGLYRVETRIRRPEAGDRRAMRGDYIHNFAVGDIYIITGQSNASGTGKGAADDGPMFGVHLFGNDEQWKIATHPIEDATNTLHPITITTVFHGYSPWLAFGKHVLVHTHVPIGLIPTALGGSSISMWVTDEGKPGPLFENMMDMLAKAGGKAAGVLWHQGESDCYVQQSQMYAERFHKLVSLLRSSIDPNIPVITGQLNSYSYSDPTEDTSWSSIREIQRRLTHELPGVYMAVTLDCPVSDEIHNSAAANVLVGERYADVALEHIYGMPIQSGFPEPGTVRFEGAEQTSVFADFINVAGDWTPAQKVDDFKVEDDAGFVPIESMQLIPPCEVRISLTRPAQGKAILHGLYGMRPSITLRDDNCRCLTGFSVPIKSA